MQANLSQQMHGRTHILPARLRSRRTADWNSRSEPAGGYNPRPLPEGKEKEGNDRVSLDRPSLSDSPPARPGVVPGQSCSICARWYGVEIEEAEKRAYVHLHRQPRGYHCEREEEAIGGDPGCMCAMACRRRKGQELGTKGYSCEVISSSAAPARGLIRQVLSIGMYNSERG
jgi:hypothetical protein